MAEWMKCSACKQPIAFEATHWECSVSTCNRNRTKLVFCTVSCWDSHVGMLRHRDAWAVEATAPSAASWQREQAALATASAPPAPAPAQATTTVQRLPSADATAPHPAESAPRRVIAVSDSTRVSQPAPATSTATGAPALNPVFEREILIVVSKMKKYIRERAGLNCSDSVAEPLSEHVRAICDAAIAAALRDDRKTVLDRDVPKPPR